MTIHAYYERWFDIDGPTIYHIVNTTTLFHTTGICVSVHVYKYISYYQEDNTIENWLKILSLLWQRTERFDDSSKLTDNQQTKC